MAKFKRDHAKKKPISKREGGRKDLIIIFDCGINKYKRKLD